MSLAKFRTFQISIEFYHLCERVVLPRHLKNQLLRASSSVSLNLAEGYGKRTAKDQRRFYYIAHGSLRESQAIILLAQMRNTPVFDKADHLGACLYKLIHGIKT